VVRRICRPLLLWILSEELCRSPGPPWRHLLRFLFPEGYVPRSLKCIEMSKT
jgi:hypothetical protein